jgi:hypothetical protein
MTGWDLHLAVFERAMSGVYGEGDGEPLVGGEGVSIGALCSSGSVAQYGGGRVESASILTDLAGEDWPVLEILLH